MKINRIGFIAFTMILLICITACSVQENKRNDAITIATRDFKFDTILVTSHGTEGSLLDNGNVGSRGFFYVLGERNKEIVLLIVPVLSRNSPYEVSWPLSFSLYESIEMLNSTEKGTLFTKNDFSKIEFIDFFDPQSGIGKHVQSGSFDKTFFIMFGLEELGVFWAIQTDNQCSIVDDSWSITFKFYT